MITVDLGLLFPIMAPGLAKFGAMMSDNNEWMGDVTCYLQAAASAAELQKEKTDVGGLQNSTFDRGIMRFGCPEGPRPGISLIFIDFGSIQSQKV